MTVSSIDKARETWDTIDIKKVRSVSWCSLSYIGRKVAFGLSPVHHATQFVHNLLGQRIESHRRECLDQPSSPSVAIWSRRCLLFETDEPVRFQEVEGYDQAASPSSDMHLEGSFFMVGLLIVTISAADSFDLIVGSHGIHHVYNLGNLFFQSHRAFTDHGLLYIYEWIGPEYLQFPLPNRIVAALLLFLLFPVRATRTTHEGRVKGIWQQCRPEEFEPSEACNSRELLPQFLKYFKPIKMYLHGGLMYPIFEGTAPNIDETKLINKLRIRIVYHAETLLTKLKIIKPLFVMAVGEKRPIRSLD